MLRCPTLSLLSFCFAKKKVTKKKAILGQRLRRPRNSSTLWLHSIYHRYGANILPIRATIQMLNRINFILEINFSIRVYGILKAPSYAQLHHFYYLREDILF